jgi:hypothetical protein
MVERAAVVVRDLLGVVVLVHAANSLHRCDTVEAAASRAEIEAVESFGIGLPMNVGRRR